MLREFGAGEAFKLTPSGLIQVITLPHPLSSNIFMFMFTCTITCKYPLCIQDA